MLIAGNWKMFHGPDPAALAGLDAVVCPPFTRLSEWRLPTGRRVRQGALAHTVHLAPLPG